MKQNTEKLICLIAFVGAGLLTACGYNITSLNPKSVTRVTGSGKVVTESRDVSGFNGVVVNGAGKLTIDRTGTESLSVTADDNLLPYIVTEVRGGKLYLEFKPNVVPDNVTDLSFNLTVKDLAEIALNGAAAIDAKNMQADHLTVNLSGAGAVKMAGKIGQQNVMLNGTGGYNAEDLECQRATITNNGAGVAIIRVSDELSAAINGAGYIEYIGNPKVTSKIAGIGAVRQR
jgi:Putative auto-transporter adhesin, head GIN domain